MNVFFVIMAIVWTLLLTTIATSLATLSNNQVTADRNASARFLELMEMLRKK